MRIYDRIIGISGIKKKENPRTGIITDERNVTIAGEVICQDPIDCKAEMDEMANEYMNKTDVTACGVTGKLDSFRFAYNKGSNNQRFTMILIVALLLFQNI